VQPRRCGVAAIGLLPTHADDEVAAADLLRREQQVGAAVAVVVDQHHRVHVHAVEQRRRCTR